MADGPDRVRQLAGRRGVASERDRARACATAGAWMTAKGVSFLLYDEDCGLCKWSLDKILAWDRSKRLRAVPIQSEEGQRLLARVNPDIRLDSWHLVRDDGTLFSSGTVAEPLARLIPTV